MADYDGILSLSGGITKRVNSSGDTITIRPALKFEGATDDDFETELAFVDPTQDNTITFPNDTGTVVINTNGGIEEALIFKAKNTSGDQILSGSAVRITGISGEVPTVGLANATGSSTMPCFGLAYNTANDNAEIDVVTFGNIKNIDTSGFSAGDIVYVNTGSGEITNAKPKTSSNLLQNIGMVIRSHANNGIIKVGGAGRSAATPNLDNGKIFIGDSTNYSSQSLYTLPTGAGTEGDVLRVNSSQNFAYVSNDDVVIAELSIPGVDLQVDTNAFRFNCPYNLTVLGLDLYLDQHTTSGNVTVEVLNGETTTVVTLSITGTNTSATTATITNPSCTSGDVITFQIDATPANAQGLRANLHYRRT